MRSSIPSAQSYACQEQKFVLDEAKEMGRFLYFMILLTTDGKRFPRVTSAGAQESNIMILYFQCDSMPDS